ncbi:type I restriction enzyme, S subunit [Ruminococcus sp. YRD2003]|uniref:restriction endonuclease subunit S n=1 Tax=Ruminococcus sp. YRD2003 TaxID=1452313 RepID=UPI0008B69E23|nr:type I restriction enzyme, S subunit [Ruminococcus flavefaciens]
MSKLKEYCINITDGEHGSVKEDLSGEYYFLNNNNITSNGIIIKPDDRRISITEFDRIHKRTKLAAGDIVIATCGTIGKCQVIRDEKINFDFSRSVGIIKCDSSRLLPDFLYYYLINPHTQNRIKKISEGGVQKHFYIGAMQEFDIEVPPIDIQRKIIAVLSAIDKKIQYNNKINDNLQHQLKLLYDYWFTQFDFPDENGKPYRASGGAMVWCDELQREIPKGWKVSTLSDIAVLQAKSVMPQAGTAYNHYSIPAFDDTHSPAVEDGEAIASNKYVVPDNSVLVSKLNPQFKRIWLIIDSTDNAICSTEFLPVKATETGVYALYSLLCSDAFSVHLIQNASSSTGSRKRIDPDNCMSYKFPYDQKVFARFDKAIQPLLMKITGIPTETQALAALRDWLLPMLMNGQATISD